jgi:hypothetical protein
MRNPFCVFKKKKEKQSDNLSFCFPENIRDAAFAAGHHVSH